LLFYWAWHMRTQFLMEISFKQNCFMKNYSSSTISHHRRFFSLHTFPITNKIKSLHARHCNRWWFSDRPCNYKITKYFINRNFEQWWKKAAVKSISFESVSREANAINGNKITYSLTNYTTVLIWNSIIPD